LEFTLVESECTEGESPVQVTLDELARQGASRMLHAALEAEVAEHLERFAKSRDEAGRALVTRNGRARERTVQLGCGEIKVRAPRGERSTRG
jgi:transposase-like protein